MNAWKKIRRDLRPLLSRVATKRATFSTKRASGRSPHRSVIKDWKALAGKLKGPGERVYLLESMNPSGSITKYDAYVVPEILREVLGDVAEPRYNLRVALLDVSKETVAQQSIPLRRNTIGKTGGLRAFQNAWWLGPFLRNGWAYSPELVKEATFQVELDQLRSVAKCAAWIEEIE